MASIDALSGDLTKPKFELNDNEFTSLKSVKDVATVEPAWKDLLEAIHDHVAENIEDCSNVPRSLKQETYRTLVDSFLHDHGSKFWTEDREGCAEATHLIWPDDHDKYSPQSWQH